MKIRIGTRGSDLARIQSFQVARQLTELGYETEMVIIDTLGDQVRDRPFAQVGAAGIFVKALEDAMLENRIDLAVHSYKDLPSISPEPLVVAAIPQRVDQADRFLVRKEKLDKSQGFLPAPQGACVGTAAARRTALLHHLRPDFKVEMLRGNLPTRLRKLREGQYDAILMASAGISRFENAPDDFAKGKLLMDGIESLRLDPEIFVPAPSQGAIAVQVRGDDTSVREAAARLDVPDARRAVTAERALLAKVEGGCQLPFGAWCRALEDGQLEMIAVLEREIGSSTRMLKSRRQGQDPLELANMIWEEFKEGLS